MKDSWGVSTKKIVVAVQYNNFAISHFLFYRILDVMNNVLKFLLKYISKYQLIKRSLSAS